MKKYFIIWLRQLKNGLSQRMAYPVNFLMMCIGAVLSMSLVLIFIQIIFSFVDKLAGWQKSEAMIVVATYMLVEGLVWATVAMLSGIATNIRTGFLDILITKPIDLQYLVSVWRADPEDWARVVIALIVLLLNIPLLGLSSWELFGNSVVYLFFVFNAYLIVYSIFVFLKSISFWVIESRYAHMVGETILQSSKYPIDIFFHQVVRVIFSTILPIAFIATVPARILIHGPKLGLVVYSSALAFVFFYLSRRFFHRGLKRYESASS